MGDAKGFSSKLEDARHRCFGMRFGVDCFVVGRAIRSSLPQRLHAKNQLAVIIS